MRLLKEREVNSVNKIFQVSAFVFVVAVAFVFFLVLSVFSFNGKKKRLKTASLFPKSASTFVVWSWNCR